LQEVNPSLEIDLSKLLVHIHHCITECNSENIYDVQLASDLQLSLTVISKLSGLPFCWNFLANPVSLDMVFFTLFYLRSIFCLQYFDTVGLASGTGL